MGWMRACGGGLTSSNVLPLLLLVQLWWVLAFHDTKKVQHVKCCWLYLVE
jgi:hypothetical protein